MYRFVHANKVSAAFIGRMRSMQANPEAQRAMAELFRKHGIRRYTTWEKDGLLVELHEADSEESIRSYYAETSVQENLQRLFQSGDVTPHDHEPANHFVQVFHWDGD